MLTLSISLNYKKIESIFIKLKVVWKKKIQNNNDYASVFNIDKNNRSYKF